MDGLRQEPRQHLRGQGNPSGPGISVPGVGRERARRFGRHRGAEQDLRQSRVGRFGQLSAKSSLKSTSIFLLRIFGLKNYLNTIHCGCC